MQCCCTVYSGLFVARMPYEQTVAWLSTVGSNGINDDEIPGLRLKAPCSDIYRQVMRESHATAQQPTTPNNTIGEVDERPVTSSVHLAADGSTNGRPKLTAAGRRAWNRLKLYVDEQGVRQRNSDTTMNWRFVREMVTALPQVQHSRSELYRRYIEHPDEWLDGLVNCPEYLTQRRQRREQQRQQDKERKNKDSKTKTTVISHAENKQLRRHNNRSQP